MVRIHDCDAAYHTASYELLKQENGGRCGCCERTGTWRVAVVPAAREMVTVSRPAPMATSSALPWAAVPGIPRVTIATAALHFGRAVLFEGRVVEVYHAPKSGTTFLQFERGNRFQALKVVIFGRHLPRFEAAGLDPETIEGDWIAVRGLLQRHARWGPQIVVHEPGCIERGGGANDE